MDEGEKPTKYFFNLEARHFLNKAIMEIENNYGTVINDIADIIDETKSFYKNLYSKRDVTPINLQEYFSDIDVPKLDDSLALEGELTLDELTQALKQMKNDKSPGPDGFTAEFLKFFWKDLGNFLCNSLNSGYRNSKLSSSLKQGVITCIPKGNKPKKYLKNWRPISLLYASYKLGSSAVANRIKRVLPTIINEDQKGFITGRYIGEVTRIIYDIMEYTETFQIPGLLVLIDFEKAFYSKDRNYLLNVLDFFGFGPNICSWISTFYNEIETRVLVNGHISSPFNVERGCRQGDPVAPYIFLLSVEILSLMLRNDKKIKGVSIRSIEYLISQFADDTTLTLDGSEKCLYAVLGKLSFFARFSGLKINAEKTRLIWIGSKKRCRYKLCKDWNLDWSQGDFTLLGIKFDIDLDNMVEKNYEEKFKSIVTQMNIWSTRILTPYGRNTLIKSLFISQLNHLFSSLPDPPKDCIDKFQKKCFQFIWQNKPDKVKRDILILNPEHGGIKAPHITEIIASQKLKWINRLHGNNNKWGNILYKQISNTELLLLSDSSYIREQIIPTLSNVFWKDVFKSWSDYLLKMKRHIKTEEELRAQSVWNNDDIKVANKSVYYRSWYKKGVTFINDFIGEDGHILSFVDFNKKYSLTTNFLSYEGMKRAIMAHAKNQNLQISNVSVRPIYPLHIRYIKNTLGSKTLYSTLLNSSFVYLPCYTKWERILNCQYNETDWKIFNTISNKCTPCTHLKWFQYKVIHNILPTKQFLHKIGYLDSPMCSLCKKDVETLDHLFLTCEHASRIWTDLETWMHSVQIPINFSIEKVILGIKGKNNNPVNAMILLTKHIIYRSSRNGFIPSTDLVKKEIIKYYNITKCIHLSNRNEETFIRFWSTLHLLFRIS